MKNYVNHLFKVVPSVYSVRGVFMILLFFSLSIFSMQINAQDGKQAYLEIIEQGKNDIAHVDALLELYKIESAISSEEASNYLDEAIVLSHQLDYEHGLARAYVMYGDYYYSVGDNDQAEASITKGKKLLEKLGDLKGVAASFNGLGRVALQRGKLDQALEYFHEGAQLYAEAGDTLGLQITQHNIGGIHYDLGQYNKAEEYWKKNLELAMTVKDTVSMVYSLLGIGDIHMAKKEYNEAIKVLQHSLQIAVPLNDPSLIATFNLNIGSQYQQLDMLDSAAHYYQKSLAIYKQIDEAQELTVQYINLGLLQRDLDNFQIAKSYLDTALEMAMDLGNIKLIENAYGGFMDVSKHLGDYEAAFEWQRKSFELQDSLTGEKVKLKISELQEKYEAEQRDKEIEQMKKREADALLVADRRMWMLIVGLTVAISLLFIILLYIGRRRAKEQRNRVELEQKALRTQMNPHFIFNSLGAIQQMYITGELDLANDYMADFSSLMRKILDNSRKDVVTIKEEFDMLRLYLELEKSRSNGLLDYEIHIDPEIDQLGSKVPPMVIQPFVENAIWHGILPSKTKKGLVSVYLNTTDDVNTLICIVEDNGVGIQEGAGREGHNSKGMKITEQRLGTKVSIQQLNPGTRVTIKIHV